MSNQQPPLSTLDVMNRTYSVFGDQAMHGWLARMYGHARDDIIGMLESFVGVDVELLQRQVQNFETAKTLIYDSATSPDPVLDFIANQAAASTVSLDGAALPGVSNAILFNLRTIRETEGTSAYVVTVHEMLHVLGRRSSHDPDDMGGLTLNVGVMSDTELVEFAGNIIMIGGSYSVRILEEGFVEYLSVSLHNRKFPNARINPTAEYEMAVSIVTDLFEIYGDDLINMFLASEPELIIQDFDAYQPGFLSEFLVKADFLLMEMERSDNTRGIIGSAEYRSLQSEWREFITSFKGI